MTEPVTTIEKILEELNTGDSQKPWVETSGIHAVRQIEVTGGKLIKDKDTGFVLKFFINRKTGEVRSFYAKYTDDPEAKNLT